MPPRIQVKVSELMRHERGARARPVLKKVAPRIDDLLEEWSTRTTPKQRITGTRLHQQLIEEGDKVGITTVREYLHEKHRQKEEVYIPLVHRAGDEARGRGGRGWYQTQGVEVCHAADVLEA